MFIPQVGVELVERFAFYERAKIAFAVVATGYVYFYLILYGVYGSLLLLQRGCTLWKHYSEEGSSSAGVDKD